MVVALHQAAASHLNRQFQNRQVDKRYLAMLNGNIKENSGEINAPIAKDRELFPRVKICTDSGREAISEFEVVKRLKAPLRTLVKFIPHTGRTHQLRIHSLFMGYPIVGCDLYHSADSHQLAKRLLLHASELYFEHPATGEKFAGHSPCPF
jgi:tRNA pseudouridine32 synthase/23S rRNA pseudouridine746 synthase